MKNALLFHDISYSNVPCKQFKPALLYVAADLHF